MQAEEHLSNMYVISAGFNGGDSARNLEAVLHSRIFKNDTNDVIDENTSLDELLGVHIPIIQ